MALTELIRSLQPKVWTLCAALGAPGEPADLVQETFIRMMRSIKSFRGESSVETWVLTIARNTCADHVRRLGRQRRLIERLKVVASTESESGGAIDRELADLLEAIDSDRREAFILTQVVGLSYQEAATVMCCAVGTIRSRVARARTDLLEAYRRSEAV